MVNIFPEIKGRIVAVDLETTGLNPRVDKIFGIALALDTGCGYDSYYWDTRQEPKSLRWLVDNLPYVSLWVNHNISFDAQFMLASGMESMPPMDCTMVRACLEYEHWHTYDLDSCLKRANVGVSKRTSIYDELASIFGGKPDKKYQMVNLPRAPVSLVADYAKDDAVGALALWKYQEGVIEEQDLRRVANLERDLTPCLVEQMYYGIRVDADLAEKTALQIDAKLVDMRKALNTAAGFNVNPNPSGSMLKLFEPKQNKAGEWYSSCGILLETTPAGKPRLDADALQRIRNPLAKDVLRIRKLTKVAETFLRGHVLGHIDNGRVHPHINQTKGEDGGTGTGRLSYNSPAMQQIPNRDKELAALVRPVFLPDEGCEWSYGDLDSNEYRMFAAYLNNRKVNHMYAGNPETDLHQFVADLTGLPRKQPAGGGAYAKALNLASVFGMGDGTIAEMLNLPTEDKSFVNKFGETISYKGAGTEAQAIINRYHQEVPGIRELSAKAKSKALADGYVTSFHGRRIRLSAHEARKAAGLLYQSGSADILKEKIIKLHWLMKDIGSRFIMTIHDEFSFSIKYGSSEVLHEAKRIVEDNPRLQIPLRVDFSRPSDNWWEATKAPIYTSGKWSGDLDELRKRVGYNG